MPKTATRARLLAAARDLLVSGAGRPPSAAAIAARAGVSRLTVYHHFGSHGGLLAAVAAEAAGRHVEEPAGTPRERLRGLVEAACARWATDPALFRRLPAAAEIVEPERLHALAYALAAADQLRPGCSLREAEDVLGLLTSFRAFDALHHDGRRSPAAVAEILLRMTFSIVEPA